MYARSTAIAPLFSRVLLVWAEHVLEERGARQELVPAGPEPVVLHCSRIRLHEEGLVRGHGCLDLLQPTLLTRRDLDGRGEGGNRSQAELQVGHHLIQLGHGLGDAHARHHGVI